MRCGMAPLQREQDHEMPPGRLQDFHTAVAGALSRGVYVERLFQAMAAEAADELAASERAARRQARAAQGRAQGSGCSRCVLGLLAHHASSARSSSWAEGFHGLLSQRCALPGALCQASRASIPSVAVQEFSAQCCCDVLHVLLCRNSHPNVAVDGEKLPWTRAQYSAEYAVHSRRPSSMLITCSVTACSSLCSSRRYYDGCFLPR